MNITSPGGAPLRLRLSLWLGAALAFSLVCSPPRPSGACSCVDEAPEVFILALDSVTRDGAPVTDLTPWQGWNVTLGTSSYANSTTAYIGAQKQRDRYQRRYTLAR